MIPLSFLVLACFEKEELAADLESDLRTVTEWRDKLLDTFNSSKTQLLSIINRHLTPDLPEINTNNLRDSFAFQVFPLPTISVGTSTQIRSLNLLPRKLDHCIGQVNFLLKRVSCTYISPQFAHAWNTAAISALVLQLLLLAIQIKSKEDLDILWVMIFLVNSNHSLSIVMLLLYHYFKDI